MGVMDGESGGDGAVRSRSLQFNKDAMVCSRWRRLISDSKTTHVHE